MELKLKGRHIGMLSKMIYKMDFVPEVAGKTVDEFGFELAWAILSHIHMAEEELWELAASIGGYDAKDMPEMELDEIKDIIMLIYEKCVNYFNKPAPE